MGQERLRFLEGRIGAPFERRVMTIEPGCRRAYEAADWKDALVVVERGDVELETCCGKCWRFSPGAVLCLEGLRLSALRSPGPAATLLVAVSRRRC
jgi:hypothetical protein